MPYISVEDRPVYTQSLSVVLESVRQAKDPVQATEMIAWWCRYVLRRFSGQAQEKEEVSFNEEQFSTELKRVLKHSGDVVANQFRGKFRENDTLALLSVAGHINYCFSAVCWGFLGDSKGFDSGRYGTRSMLAENLRKVRDGITASTARKETMFKGVLNDVLDEMYRRKTAVYEDVKIVENGDVWTDGLLPVKKIEIDRGPPIVPVSG